MENIAIKVQGVSKSFKLPHEKQGSIKSMFVNILKPHRSYEKQKVLKDVSFEIKKGEFFGIVGRNGSGKSTLLKLLAGIYSQDEGSIEVDGKLTPFIELGVGFNQDLTGRENVYLNGALLGFNRKEMEEMYDEIVEFAELDNFMDQKLKNYSSGMQVRLAFSIAIRAKTEILLIDEVLAVGDAAFQKKCYAVFQSLKREGRTVVFVTHGMGDVERFCDRVLVIDKGLQVGIFEAHEGSVKYEKINQQASGDTTQNNDSRWGTGPVRVKSVAIYSDGEKIRNKVHPNKSLKIQIDLESVKPPKEYERSLVMGMNIFSEDGHNLFGPNTIGKNVPIDSRSVALDIQSLPLNRGKYYLTIALFDEKMIETYDHLDRTISFEIDSDNKFYGSIDTAHSWKIEANTK